jgi:hypothetical protein
MAMGPLATFSRSALFEGLFWKLASRYFCERELHQHSGTSRSQTTGVGFVRFGSTLTPGGQITLAVMECWNAESFNVRVSNRTSVTLTNGLVQDSHLLVSSDIELTEGTPFWMLTVTKDEGFKRTIQKLLRPVS